MTTNVNNIEIALGGRSHLIKQILQAVFGKPKEDLDAQRLATATPNPEAAAQQLMAFVGRRQAKGNRDGVKKKPK